MKDTTGDHRKEVALFRYGLIPEALHLPPDEAARHLRRQSERELAAGKTLFLDFKASWCSTCAAQERVIATLRSDNPDYDRHILFVDVDWDLFQKDSLTRSLAIPRRSTLVVLKGDRELGRIVAGTSRSEIQELLDVALSAATS